VHDQMEKSEGESGDEARLVRLAWVGHRACYGE